MHERVVENWLTRVNERSYEIPFCQLLTGEGYQVIHLSRHGPFEEGKDILAIDPSGVPCAFQLKSGTITLNTWAKEVEQITRLVEVPIIHPSINSDLPRRVYLVTTGELDEEVRLEIDHRNREWEKRRYPKLEMIVKGQLLNRLQAIHTNLWPIQLISEKTLLEFFLSDGDDCLDKGKLAEFVLSLLPLFSAHLNKAESSRAIASTAILTAYALSPYQEKSNHVALIEGWLVYIACLVALVEKIGLEEGYWKDSLAISRMGIEQAFDNLCDELKSRTHLVEGNALVDYPFYRGRVTWLLGLVASYALWKSLIKPEWIVEDWFKTFIHNHQEHFTLWGEAAIPQFLAIIWFLRKTTDSFESDQLLANLIHSICAANADEHSMGLPDPYHELTEVAEEIMLRQHHMKEIMENYDYRGRSYAIEALVQLYTRRNLREQLERLWPEITRVEFAEFRPDEAWEMCLWRSDENGTLIETVPKMTQSWAELRNQASQVDTSLIPKIFQEYPELLLLFTITYPHRLTKDVAKFLDDKIQAI